MPGCALQALAIAIVRKHQVIPRRLRQRFDTEDNIGEYLVGKRWYQHPDGVAGRSGKQIRRTVGNITNLFGNREDAFAQAFRDRFRVTQAAAYRHFGSPYVVGNILQGGAFFLQKVTALFKV